VCSCAYSLRVVLWLALRSYGPHYLLHLCRGFPAQLFCGFCVLMFFCNILLTIRIVFQEIGQLGFVFVYISRPHPAFLFFTASTLCYISVKLSLACIVFGSFVDFGFFVSHVFSVATPCGFRGLE